MISPRHGLAALCATVLLVGAGLTATNTVASSRVGTGQDAIDANALKPPECASLDLAKIVAGSGTVNGNGASDLLVGGPGDDRLKGKGGTDCILGGAGDDDLWGNGGSDVCIGGPGNDTFRNCNTIYP
jgi:Ca2+-binding RTX toxin-like protein